MMTTTMMITIIEQKTEIDPGYNDDNDDNDDDDDNDHTADH